MSNTVLNQSPDPTNDSSLTTPASARDRKTPLHLIKNTDALNALTLPETLSTQVVARREVVPNKSPFSSLTKEQDSPLPNPETIPLTNRPFDPTPYITQFEKSYPAEMTLLKLLGVHPSSGSGEFYDPFGKRKVSDNFSNIGEHTVAVAVCTKAIAETLQTAGIFDANDVNYVTRRALMHDASKVYDIFLVKAQREGLVSTTDYDSESIWNRAIPTLVERGISADDARKILRDYGSETGGRPDCIKRFLEVGPNGLGGIIPNNLRMKVVHLADDMMCSTPPNCPPTGRHWVLTPMERVSGAFAGKKCPRGWSAGLGVDASGQLKEVEDVVNPTEGVRPLGTYHGLMIWISNQISRELVHVLAPNLASEKPPEQVIKEIVNYKLLSVE